MPVSPCPTGQTRNLKTKLCRDKLKKGVTKKATASHAPCPPGQTRNLKTKLCRDKLKKGATKKAVVAAPAHAHAPAAKANSPKLKVVVLANSIKYTMALCDTDRSVKEVINNIGAFNNGSIVGFFLPKGIYCLPPKPVPDHADEYSAHGSDDDTFKNIYNHAKLSGMWVVFKSEPGDVGHVMSEIVDQDLYRPESWDVYQSNGKTVGLIRDYDLD